MRTTANMPVVSSVSQLPSVRSMSRSSQKFSHLTSTVPREVFRRRRPEDQEAAVLPTCSSLISIANNRSSRIVQFSQLSVKEFLTPHHLASSTGDLSRFHILPRTAHT